ncbi:MAG: DUF3367 domain-containing protein [Acidimicrobiia bacterium]|nr:DUF3367 domain-containing protein [Acidimicrobiia bacterium]
MAQTATRAPRGPARRPAPEVLGAIVLAYLPFFLSSPGRLSSDTKQYLYLDPGRFLTRVPWLWDPHVAAGTVPHQHIGYLFPMGPFFWLSQQLGLADWVAQRVWLGSISLLAVLGARWLFLRLGLSRTGAAVAALVYVLSPYQLSFTARMSVLLLPWAALPWVIGLTIRAARRGGWRDPAAIALIVLTIGGVNASALLLMAVGPALWLAMELGGGRDRARAAVGVALRVGLLSGLVSLWWLAGLWAQASFGLPVLQLTENVRTISTASAPGDLLRGLGNWFFYGYDRGGFSLVQTSAYVSERIVVVASFAIPALALASGALVRWRHRAFFAACIVVGTVVGVGAWPFDDTTAYGRLWRAFTDQSSLGLALRNTPRVVPVVVLGVAGLIGAAITSIRVPRVRLVALATVVGLVVAAFLPVWRHGYFTPGTERPESIPGYWTRAISALDRESHRTRILEIPGSSFATYQWGNTVEPITPGLTDRPYLAREVLPYGSPESVNLLDAFDRRLQNGSFEPNSLAPIARIFGVGTIALRSDLAYERSGGPHSREVWSALTQPRAPGLGEPFSFGPVVPPIAAARDATDLRANATADDPPAVSIFPVEDPLPIVRTASDADPIVMAGDGDGIVDLAAAGLITGQERILELAAESTRSLRHALDTGAHLVLTDTNRRRVTSFFSSIRDTKGATERAGQTTHDVNGYDEHLDPFSDSSDRAHTVVEQGGGRVDASADGGADRPEDRAARAFDGDVRTAWRVGGIDPSGEWIRIRPAHPVTASGVTVVQPQGLPRDRWVTKVEVTVNHTTSVTATLGPQSFAPGGQRIPFPAASVRSLRATILETRVPPFDPVFANAVGFAEIRLGDVQVHETVRLPTDLEQRVGAAASQHSLSILMTRLRQDTGTEGRQDEELNLDRRFVTPNARDYALRGTVRINPDAGDAALDDLLATAPPGVTYEASSHLSGSADGRASRGFTATTDTAWTSAYGPQAGQWIEVTLPQPIAVDHITASVVTDRWHSTPTALTVSADGVDIGSTPVTASTTGRDAERPVATSVTVATTPTRARTVRLTVTDTAPPPGEPPSPARIPPVSLADIQVAPSAVAPTQAVIDGTCRSNTLRIDGRAVPVQIETNVSDQRDGMALAPCRPGISLDAGSHRVSTTRGWDTGLDVDRIVLDSTSANNAAPGRLLVPNPPASEPVRVHRAGPDHVTATVDSDGTPFWFVFGESRNDGWHATVDGRSVGASSLVNGYANAWRVQPRRAGPVTITLTWAPQRTVWWGIGLSLAGVLLCLALVPWRRGRTRSIDAAEPPSQTPIFQRFATVRLESIPLTLTWMVATFLVTAFVSRVAIGVVAAIGVAVARRFPRSIALIGIGAGGLVLLSRIGHRPELGWLALALFAVAAITNPEPSGDLEGQAPGEPERSSPVGADTPGPPVEH